MQTGIFFVRSTWLEILKQAEESGELDAQIGAVSVAVKEGLEKTLWLRNSSINLRNTFTYNLTASNVTVTR